MMYQRNQSTSRRREGWDSGLGRTGTNHTHDLILLQMLLHEALYVCILRKRLCAFRASRDDQDISQLRLCEVCEGGVCDDADAPRAGCDVRLGHLRVMRGYEDRSAVCACPDQVSYAIVLVCVRSFVKFGFCSFEGLCELTIPSLLCHLL